MHVVVKVALERRQRAALLHEYNIYKHLPRDARGIPQTLGLFRSADNDTAFLILTDEGHPIDCPLFSAQK